MVRHCNACSTATSTADTFLNNDVDNDHDLRVEKALAVCRSLRQSSDRLLANDASTIAAAKTRFVSSKTMIAKEEYFGC